MIKRPRWRVMGCIFFIENFTALYRVHSVFLCMFGWTSRLRQRTRNPGHVVWLQIGAAAIPPDEWWRRHRLLRSPSPMTIGLPVGYETWLAYDWIAFSILWLADPNIVWEITCTEFWVISHELWSHVTGGNFHRLQKASDNPRAQPKSLPPTRMFKVT